MGAMKGKIGGLLVLFLGVLLIAGGLVLKFAVLPALAVWPDDVDSTRTYEGTLVTMLNPQALASGDLANLFLSDVPVTVDRHVTTEQVEGNQALVREQVQARGPDGELIPGLQTDEDGQHTTYWYAIDRNTTEEIPNFTDNPGVDDNRQGLVIGFPIGTEQRDYEGWSDDLQRLEPVEFVGVEEHEGATTYHFSAGSAPQPLLDPALLAMFPQSMPKAVVAGLAPQLGLSQEMMQQFAQLLPALPDPIPFTYLYEYATEYWVEPTTGMLIDYTKDETRILAIQVDPSIVSIGMVPVGGVFQLIYEQSDQSIADAKQDAEDGKGTINLFGTIIPFAAIGVGALLALGGAYLMARKREEEAAS
jgi:hypothetical protein